MFGCINDYTSKTHSVTCSVPSRRRYILYICSLVPQGSVLAPLFFLLYINDISNVIKNSKILLYADDLTLYRVLNNAYDAALLQQDLTSICNWAKA